MSDESLSEVERRTGEMKSAREEWERASAEMKEALALLCELNLTPSSPDGNLALKNTRLRESAAFEKYIAAVKHYSDAALRAGGIVPPES